MATELRHGRLTLFCDYADDDGCACTTPPVVRCARCYTGADLVKQARDRRWWVHQKMELAYCPHHAAVMAGLPPRARGDHAMTIPQIGDDTDPEDYPVCWGGSGYTLDAYTSNTMTTADLVARIILCADRRHWAVAWHKGGAWPWIQGPRFDDWTGDAKLQAMRHIEDAVRCPRTHTSVTVVAGQSTCDGCGAIWFPERTYASWYGISPSDGAGGRSVV